MLSLADLEMNSPVTIAPGEKGLLGLGELNPGRALIQAQHCLWPPSRAFVPSSGEIGSLESCECVFKLSDREGKKGRRGGRGWKPKRRAWVTSQRRGSAVLGAVTCTVVLNCKLPMHGSWGQTKPLQRPEGATAGIGQRDLSQTVPNLCLGDNSVPHREKEERPKGLWAIRLPEC